MPPAPCPDVPTFAIGYSFGAMMALACTDSTDGRVLIAPALAMRTSGEEPTEPLLVLAPSGDQFTEPEAALEIVSAWPDTEFHELPDTDHFLAGATNDVASRVATWLQRRV